MASNIIPPPPKEITLEWRTKLESAITSINDLAGRDADEVEWFKIGDFLEDLGSEIDAFASGTEVEDDDEDDDEELEDDDDDD